MTDIQTLKNVRQKTQKKLFKKANVVGIGVGFKEIESKKSDELALKVLVREKKPLSALSKKDIIPKDFDGIKTDVNSVGHVVAFKTPQDRWRPAPPGVSIGHYAITAGTFGAVVRDAATNEQLILSNNHVLANSNNAKEGDTILQPGSADGGRAPQDRIADLHRFVKIQYKGGGGGDNGSSCPLAQFFSSFLNMFASLFGSDTRVVPVQAAATNLVDAALAKPVSNDVLDEKTLNIGKVQGSVEAEIGMLVKKSGRTTGLTHGEITVLDTSVEVNYGSQTALFEHQILTGDMSDPGDSGSLIVDNQNRAVGLLFAGSDTVTVINPIDAVLTALNITI